MNSLPQHYLQLPHHSHDQNSFTSPSKDFVNNVQRCLLAIDNAGSDSNVRSNFTLPHRYHALSASSHHIPLRSSEEFKHQLHTSQGSPGKNWNNSLSRTSDRMSAPVAALNALQISNNIDTKELPTPSSTPTTSRKSRRRSNLFIPSSKKPEVKLSELGVGRAIPIKQGYLYKRSSNSLNKEWKKKYVTLCDDGRLTYHSSLHDYMDDIHGKEIALNCVTVKLPGQKPRGSKTILTNSTLSSSVNSYWKATNNAISDGIAGLTLPKDRKISEKLSFDSFRDSLGKTNNHMSGDEGVVLSNSNSQTFLANENANSSKHNESQSSNSSYTKKRHRRMKSSGVKHEVDGNFLPEYSERSLRWKSFLKFLMKLFPIDTESFEFVIVSLEGKQWHFEAASCEERDKWVQVIDQEIFKTLQSNISNKSKLQKSNDSATLHLIKEQVPGNRLCADCDAVAPEWASLKYVLYFFLHFM